MAPDSSLTLRALLEDPSPGVAANAGVIAQYVSAREEVLDKTLDQLVAAMVQRRQMPSLLWLSTDGRCCSAYSKAQSALEDRQGGGQQDLHRAAHLRKV